jgi:hypothetical protein
MKLPLIQGRGSFLDPRVSVFLFTLHLFCEIKAATLRLVSRVLGLGLRVWDAAGGREPLTVGRLASAVWTVSWSPDGARLATGSGDGTAKVWDAASVEAVQEWARQNRAAQDLLARNAFRGPHARGFIKTWLLLLPLPFTPGETGAQALDRQQLPGEANLRPRLGERVLVGGREMVWQEHRSPEAAVNFNEVLERVAEQSVAYAVCYLESGQARDGLWLQVGSDDQAEVYLNGRQIYLVTQERCRAGRDNHSDMDQTWSVNPAAIAGLRFTPRPSASLMASVRTGQQKL